MHWGICLIISIGILFVGIWKAYSMSRSGKRRGRFLNAFHLFIGSVFLSGMFLFLPIYYDIFSGEVFRISKTLLLSIHNTIRLFLVDGDYDIVIAHISSEAGVVYHLYTIYAAVIYVLAPILSFSVVLSFFKNLSAYRKYILAYNKPVFVFSELNEKSLTLAESIKEKSKGSLLVFTDVFEDRDEESYELNERAKELGAVCFKKDICVQNFRFHNKRNTLFFFVISENQSENLDHAMTLIQKYKDIPNTNLFVFSDGTDSELLLNSTDKGHMRVRRINEERAVINNFLFQRGAEIFRHAKEIEGKKKQITIVVVGLGRYGQTIVKSLSWFGQMTGYEMNIEAFDKDPLAFDKLYVQCPELLSEEYNGVYMEGEAYYKISIHSDIHENSKAFMEQIESLKDATDVFVCLDCDEENIRVATYLRMLFERNGGKPAIHAVVTNSKKVNALKDATNFKGQKYDIDYLGDTKSFYSADLIVDSYMEKDALERHLKYGQEEDFWNYEYNYMSSIASSIHMKARIDLGKAGAGKKENELTEEEAMAIEILEHCRWNAYMRSEGYVYSKSKDPSSRNDLGKMHHNLVDFAGLEEDDKRKDRRVASR